MLKCDGNEVTWKTVSFSPLDFSLCELLYVCAPTDSYSILFCNLYCLYFKVVVGACSGGGGWGHKVSREVFLDALASLEPTQVAGRVIVSNSEQ